MILLLNFLIKFTPGNFIEEMNGVNKQNRNTVFDLEYFFELSPDLLCVSGYDGYFKKINPAVSQTLGYTRDELLSNPIDSFIHVEDRDITKRKRELIKSDIPLLNFENRYITKSGNVVWLSWTSMPIKTEKLVFAIAKNISYKKKFEEYRRISSIITNTLERKNIAARNGSMNIEDVNSFFDTNPKGNELSPADKTWLSEFEILVRNYIGKTDFKISMLSNEMAMSERQLYRRIKAIMGITPNVLIRIIRLELAREAIETGKYRTISEIAYAAGFETPAYFSKLFKEIYSIDVGELL